MTKEISILRLDHRTYRDHRISTHVALTARAIGASHFYYSGERDENLEKSVLDVKERWGGDFKIAYVDKVSKFLKEWDDIKVHLTMYGENFKNTIPDLSKNEFNKLLCIVGGAKVPAFVYGLADFNTSIGHQPHSEVSAIAIFLYELTGSSGLYHTYEDAKIIVDGTSSKAKRGKRFQ